MHTNLLKNVLYNLNFIWPEGSAGSAGWKNVFFTCVYTTDLCWEFDISIWEKGACALYGFADFHLGIKVAKRWKKGKQGEGGKGLQILQLPHGYMPFSGARSVSQLCFFGLWYSEWTNLSFRLVALLAISRGLSPTKPPRIGASARICQCWLKMFFYLLPLCSIPGDYPYWSSVVNLLFLTSWIFIGSGPGIWY